jgi:hypothetical protein
MKEDPMEGCIDDRKPQAASVQLRGRVNHRMAKEKR